METSKGKTLCFVSWNTNGFFTQINSNPKIYYITKELKRQQAEIVFLQETHIGPKNYNEFIIYTEGWKRFFTIYDSESKGVAILIHENVPFQYICHDEDYSGGYLVLFCHLYGELFTLVNVYNHKHDTDVLNRLQEYLRETAVGVLVVGGDFNTVLDLTFDQKKASGYFKLGDAFEKFTASLNLMDTWAHLHPTEKAFTRSQNMSFSRLDMFLMPEDIIERVSNVNIYATQKILKCKDNATTRTISDHEPVVLSLTLSKPRKKMIDASLFKEITYGKHERAGKINGAEILSVINSLTDSQQVHPDGITIQTYKIYRCQFTEILKEPFKDLLNCKKISDDFKKNTCVSGNRKIFNVNYLIFTMILAKRLSMLLLVPPENKSQPNIDCYIVTSEKTVRIKWTFLKKILTFLCDTWKDNKKKKEQPQSDFIILEALGVTQGFRILDSILPKVSSTSDDFRELQEGCPLTRSIISLVLKYLQILFKEKQYENHICFFRQVLVIHKNNTGEGFSEVQRLLEEFSENGIKLNIQEMNKS